MNASLQLIVDGQGLTRLNDLNDLRSLAYVTREQQQKKTNYDFLNKHYEVKIKTRTYKTDGQTITLTFRVSTHL